MCVGRGADIDARDEKNRTPLLLAVEAGSLATVQWMVHHGAAANSACDNQGDNGLLMAFFAAHCHTPACMSLELWNDDTGELICRNAPTYGNGNAAMNENSYVISIPPCLFGTKEEGLLPPPVLSLDSNLTTIKLIFSNVF